MMRPWRRSIMPGATSLISRNAAFRCVSMIAFQASSGKETAGARCCWPALFTRMSIGPSVAITSRAAAVSVTSNGAGRVAMPSRPSASAVAATDPDERPFSATSAPASPSARAIAKPMPRVEPVTSARWPLRSKPGWGMGCPLLPGGQPAMPLPDVECSPAGSMLWFTRNGLFGSYLRFTATSPSQFAPEDARSRPATSSSCRKLT